MMKSWKLFLAVLLCSGLGIALGLSGCGDDDDEGDARCDAACNKIVSCEADFVQDVDMTVQECVDGCKSDPVAEAECGFGCDTSAACPVYAACIEIICGISFD